MAVTDSLQEVDTKDSQRDVPMHEMYLVMGASQSKEPHSLLKCWFSHHLNIIVWNFGFDYTGRQTSSKQENSAKF